MQVVANMEPSVPLSEVASHAQRVEALGYDALHIAETVHDSFQVSLLALEHTTRLVVRTAITVAFPRSPMVSALAAWDLARFSGGRFGLGLGTQIRTNIVERYSAPWTEPVGRMREYVVSVRAIFRSFQTGEPLRFEGEHYRFIRLQPYFNPGPLDVAEPYIWLGGVNPAMCRLAGEIADGFITHPTNSNPRYLEEVCRPNLEEGARRSGRSIRDLGIVVGGPVVTGSTQDEVAAERDHQRRTLAFLYSTPAYSRSLELFGWADLSRELRHLTREAKWDDLPRLISEDVLDALVPQATYDELPEVIRSWYGGLADGVLIPPPRDPSRDQQFAETIRAVRNV